MKTVFKCTHNIVPSYLRDLFKVRNERMTTRSKKYLIQPKVRTTRYGLNSSNIMVPEYGISFTMILKLMIIMILCVC